MSIRSQKVFEVPGDQKFEVQPTSGQGTIPHSLGNGMVGFYSFIAFLQFVIVMHLASENNPYFLSYFGVFCTSLFILLFLPLLPRFRDFLFVGEGCLLFTLYFYNFTALNKISLLVANGGISVPEILRAYANGLLAISIFPLSKFSDNSAAEHIYFTNLLLFGFYSGLRLQGLLRKKKIQRFQGNQVPIRINFRRNRSLEEIVNTRSQHSSS